MVDITVVIPAYNETTYIQQTLKRLTSVISDSTVIFEILVVDNGSTDSTAELAAAFSDVKVLDLGQRENISVARNRAASEASGKLLAFIDADVLVTREWSSHLQQRFVDIASSRTLITGAPYRVSEQPSWLERYWYKSMEERKPRYINAGNLIVSKELFERLGGFHPDLVTGEDLEFCLRAKKEGMDIESDPDFIVHHEGYPKGLVEFFKRELWAGRGDFVSLTAFLKSKTAIPAAIVVTLLVFGLLSMILGWWYWLAVAMGSIAVISMVSVIYKYGYHSFRRFVVNSVVMVVYFVARTFAFVDYQKKA